MTQPNFGNLLDNAPKEILKSWLDTLFSQDLNSRNLEILVEILCRIDVDDVNYQKFLEIVCQDALKDGSERKSMVLRALAQLACKDDDRLENLLEACLKEALGPEDDDSYTSLKKKWMEKLDLSPSNTREWRHDSIAQLLTFIPQYCTDSDLKSAFYTSLILLTSSEKSVRTMTSTQVIPKLLQWAENKEALQDWTSKLADFINLVETCPEGDAINFTALALLIACFDSFMNIPKEQEQVKQKKGSKKQVIQIRQTIPNFDLRCNHTFFILVQRCLGQPGKTIKLAQFLLKRIVDFTIKFDTPPSQPWSRYYSLPIGNDTHQFRTLVEPIWQEFFLLFETLEGSISHLFKPLQDKMVQFMKKCSTNQTPTKPCLDESWWSTIIHHGFTTELSSMKKTLVNVIMSIDEDESIQHLANQTDTLFNVILPSLDNDSVYYIPGDGTSISPVGEAVVKFWKRIYDTVPESDRSTFLEKCIKYRLRSSAALIFHLKALSGLQSPQGGVWNMEMLDSLTQYVRKWGGGGLGVGRFDVLNRNLRKAIKTHVSRKVSLNQILNALNVTGNSNDIIVPELTEWLGTDWKEELMMAKSDLTGRLIEGEDQTTFWWIQKSGFNVLDSVAQATETLFEKVTVFEGDWLRYAKRLRDLVVTIGDHFDISQEFFQDYCKDLSKVEMDLEQILDRIWIDESLLEDDRQTLVDLCSTFIKTAFKDSSFSRNVMQNSLKHLKSTIPTKLEQDGKSIALQFLTLIPSTNSTEIQNTELIRYPLKPEDGPWGLRLSKFHRLKYLALNHCTISNPDDCWKSTVQDLQNSTGLSSPPMLNYCHRLMEHVSLQVLDDTLEQAIEGPKQLAFDTASHAGSHHIILHAFIKMAFAPRMLRDREFGGPDGVISKLIPEVLEFGTGKTDAVTQMADALTRFWSSDYQPKSDREWSSKESLESNLELVVQLLCFGPKRDAPHHVLDTSLTITDSDEQVEYAMEWDSHARDYLVRTYMNHALLQLDPKTHSQFAKDLILQLIFYDEVETEMDALKHFNTMPFRKLIRQWSTIILLLPHLQSCTEDELVLVCEHIIKRIEKNVITSVRRLMEWSLMLLFRNHPDKPKVADVILKGLTEYGGKPLIIISLFIVLLHTLNVLHPIKAPGAWKEATNSEWEHWRRYYYKKALDLTIPWTCSNHFSIRLIAQFVLLAIWETCKEQGNFLTLPETGLSSGHLKSLVEGEQVLGFMQDFLTRNPESVRFRNDSFLESFMFYGFNPCQDFTLDFLFRGHARLTLVSRGEWITWHAFARRSQELSLESWPNPIILVDPERMDIYLSAGTGKQEVELEKTVATDAIQRKILPWESLMDATMLDLDRDEHIFSSQGKEGLIVFASLIGKAPNLGGLARSSEIFGAERLIVPNLNVLESIEFRSVAVTAQKWIPIECCLEKDMVKYLIEKKQQGYTLVGLEQTSTSVPLQEYDFPSKVVLILGAEGSGIPADLLVLCDTCVEIPQVGVTRSLNVHVSAAIAIWEWRRQRL